jgi:serine/threonine-protein kinase
MTGDVERLNAALVGRYAIEREVGHGGAAVVYLAQDLKYDRSVALKVLRPEVANCLGPDRFLREIRITARLQHPHILPLLEAGEADGSLYYVMPYVEGHSLRKRLARARQLPLDEVVSIGQDVASALAYAHAHDVLHRDIKPENILLSGGQAVVGDFGIARAITIAGSDPSTASGVALGTPAYMSPEQAACERALDGRSDIYSLGCVLYEMLVGDPPFSGATAQAIAARHAADPVPPVRTVRPVVSERLEGLIFKAMAKLPADRFATAAELARALARLPRATPAAITPAAPAPAAPGAPTPSGGASIVVLPFVNLSADPEDEYFSDGLSEELMTALGQVAGLRVVARTSAFAFKGKDADVRAIGRRLGVGAVLTGTVRKAQSRLRITAQLVNAVDGYQLWSQQYDRAIDDVFAIQDEITDAIVKVLKVTLLGGERAGLARPVAQGGLEAYELYLKGRYFWNKRTELAFDRAIECFRQVLERDAGYAPALAGLADCYTILGIYGVRAPQEVMPLAKDAAARALALDPSLAEAHTSVGCARATFDFDWTGADQAFRRAIELKPSYPTAHQWYALNCLAPQGRLDEAMGQLQTAHELDPLSAVITTSIGVLHYFARRYNHAVTAYRQTLEIDDRFALAHYFLGLALTQLGSHDEAVATLRQGIALSGGGEGGTAEARAALAYAYARAGRRREATMALAELLELGERRYVSPSLVAVVHAGLGDTERALAALQAAYAARAADLVWLRVRPAFDGLRDHPRYAALLAGMGLAVERG